MKTVVLGTRRSRPTASLLASRLMVPYAEDFIPYDELGMGCCIRYGNGYTVSRAMMEINPLNSVKKAIHKPTTRKCLISNCISVPPTILELGEITDKYKAGALYVARPPQHFQGNGFYLCRTPDEIKRYLLRGMYVQEVIEKKDEYRVFMWKDRIMESIVKVKARSSADMMIRNYHRGWRFERVPVIELLPTIKAICRNVNAILDLHFCAIDLATTDDNSIFVFEVNSAPGLIPRRVDALATKIEETIGRQNPDDHERIPSPIADGLFR